MTDNKIELSGIFSEGYGFVPKRLMRAKDISATTKNILCYLLSFTGAGVTCFPQIQDIADDLGITTRTVIRSINAATNAGYLKKHQENRGRGIGKKNSYELLFMYDFNKNQVKNHVTKKSRDKLSCDTTTLSCDKNDTYHVTPGQSNNNNNNNSNNNKAGEEIFFHCDYFSITTPQHEKYVLAYPGLDFAGEYNRMSVWLDNNPKKRKSNYPKFVNGWLSRQFKDRAKTSTTEKSKYHDFDAEGK